MVKQFAQITQLERDRVRIGTEADFKVQILSHNAVFSLLPG